MRDAVGVLDEVEARGDGGEGGELGLAHGEEVLDGVDDALVERALVQHAAEALKDGREARGRERGERRARRLGKGDGDLDRVVRGRLEQQRRDKT